jgi:hypothetical protein
MPYAKLHSATDEKPWPMHSRNIRYSDPQSIPCCGYRELTEGGELKSFPLVNINTSLKPMLDFASIYHDSRGIPKARDIHVVQGADFAGYRENCKGNLAFPIGNRLLPGLYCAVNPLFSQRLRACGGNRKQRKCLFLFQMTRIPPGAFAI